MLSVFVGDAETKHLTFNLSDTIKLNEEIVNQMIFNK